MSSTVDNRVVQMTMDNAKFEQKSEQTLTTLDKLKRALNMDDAAGGFDKVQDAADRLTLDNIATNIQSLSDRFSGLGIVGMTIWQNIGNAAWDFVNGALSKVGQGIETVTNQIKTGGWNRALNLEKAETMINTLGESAGYAWDQNADHFKEGMKSIKDSVSAAVDGTAYSLDEAAVAASNFLATGVDGGEQLTETLRAVMGTASTYSKDFSTIARVFQNVSARGYLMYGDISDLQANGVAASQIMTEYLGISAEELDQAYKDKLIDFDTFKDAFLDKFGNSLDKANDTYEGSLSNLKSALSRIGAEVATPLLNNLIPIFNNLRILTNSINTLFKDLGVYDTINNTVGSIAGWIADITKYETDANGKLVTNSKLLEPIHDIIGGIASALDVAIQFFKDIGTAIKTAFGGENESLLLNIIARFNAFFVNLYDNYGDHQDAIISGFTKFFKIIKGGISIVKSIASVAINALKTVWGWISPYIKSIDFGKIFTVISNGFTILAHIAGTIWERLKGLFEGVSGGLSDIFEHSQILTAIKEVFETVFGFVSEKVGAAWDAIKGFADLIATNPLDIMHGLDISITEIFMQIKDAATNAKEAIIGFFEDPGETLSAARDKIVEVLDTIKTKLSGLFGEDSKTQTVFTNISTNVENFGEKLTGAKEKLVDFANTSDENLEKSEKSFSIFDTLKSGLEKLGEVLGTLKDFAVSIGGGLFDILKNIFLNLVEVFKDMTWEDVFQMIKAAIAFVIAVDFDTLLTKITDFVDGLSTVLQPAQTTAAKQKNTFRSIGTMILEFGIAIALFAYSIGKLNDMDLDRSKQSVGLIAEIIAVFTGAFAVMKKLSGVKKDAEGVTKSITGFGNGEMKTFGAVMVEMAAAMYVIAKAMAQLSDMDVDKITPMMAAFAVGLGELIAAVFASGKLLTGTSAKFIKQIATAMIELSIAVLIISKAMTAVGSLDPDQFNQGLIGVSAIIGLVTGFVAVVEILGKSKAGEMGPSFAALGVALVLFSAAIDLILPAVVILGKIKPETMNQGLVGIASIAAIFGIMMLLGGVAAKMDKMAMISFMVAATAFIEIAAAIDLLVPAVIVLGMMDKAKLIQGVAALSVVMGLFTVLAAVAGKASSVTGTAAIVAITIAMASMTKNLEKIAKIDAQGLKRALIAMSVGIAEFVAVAVIVKAAKLGPSMLVFANSMVVFSTGLLLLTASLAVLAHIDAKKLAKALIALAAGIAVLVVAALAIKKLKLGPALLELSVSMLAMGAAAVLISTGIILFCTALTLIGPAIAIAIESISLIFKAISDLAESFDDALDDIVQAVYVLAEDIVKVLVAAILGALDGILESLDDLIDKVVKLVTGIIDGLTDHMAELVTSLFNFIVSLINETGLYLETHSEEIKEAFQNLLTGILTVGLELVKDFKDFGLELCWGILEGMCEFEWYDKLTDWVADHIIAPICEFLGIESPSTYMRDNVGVNIIAGLWEAFVNGAKELYDNLIGWVADNIIGPIVDKYEEIKDKGKALFNKLKDGIHEAKQAVVDKAKEVWNGIKGFFEDPLGTMKSLGQSVLTNLKEGMEFVKGTVIGVAEKAWEGIKGAFKGVKEFFGGIIDDIKGVKEVSQEEFFEENGDAVLGAVGKLTGKSYKYVNGVVVEQGKSIGTNFANGFGNGVQAQQNYVNTMAAQMARGAYQSTTSTLTIESPSRLMMQVGKFFDMGFAEGISDNSDIVANSASEMIDTILTYFDPNNVNEGLSISPVLDLSEIQNGAGAISDIINKARMNTVANVDIVGNDTRTANKMEELADYMSELKIVSDNTALEAKIAEQNTLIAALTEKLDSLSVYIDSGALVGGISGKMDKALGVRAGYVGRSVMT